MFIEVPVILAGAKSSVLLFDEEEGSGLRGVGGTDFSSTKIFIKEGFGSELFVGGERVELPDFWGKRVGEVNFVIVRSRRGDMVSSFFIKDRRKLGVFGGKNSFGFCGFSSCGKLSGDSEAGDYWGSHGNKVGATSNDSVEGSIFAGSVDVGGFFFPLVVLEEARICDGVYINVARGASGGFKEGVVSFIVDFMGGEEEFGFVDGFVDGESPVGPIDDWVGSPQPGESKDDVVF